MFTAEKLKSATKKAEEQFKLAQHKNSKVDDEDEWVAFSKNSRGQLRSNKELYGIRVSRRNDRVSKTGKTRVRLFVEIYKGVLDKIAFSKTHHNLKPFFSSKNDNVIKLCKCKKPDGFSPATATGGMFRFGVMIQDDKYQSFGKLTTYVSYEIKDGDIIMYLDKKLGEE